MGDSGFEVTYVEEIFCLLIVIGLSGCVDIYKRANENAVEKLNEQVKNERFEEIYDGSSKILKATVSKDEFIKKMKLAVEKMKALDKKLNWEKDEQVKFDESVFRSDNFSYRVLKNENKQVGINIDWQESFVLCGFSVWDESPDGETIAFRGCG